MRSVYYACAFLLLPATSNAGLFSSGSSAAHINSCSNVTTNFSYYFRDDINQGFGFFARGTFRILGETDESRQPDYNLTQVACDRKPAELGAPVEFECKTTRASVGGFSGPPDANQPSCTLDVDVSTYDMKELSRDVLVGIADGGSSTSCFNNTLTINRVTKRVSITFERTQYADNYDRIKAETCGRIGIPVGEKSTKRTLLVINGAGGVGSILIQLARQVSNHQLSWWYGGEPLKAV